MFIKTASFILDLSSFAIRRGPLLVNRARYLSSFPAQAIRYINKLSEDEEGSPTIHNSLKISCYLNKAAAELKLSDYEAVEKDTSMVLEMDGLTETDKAKALYRLGVARGRLGKTEEALLNLEEAQKLSPNDPGISKEIATVKKRVAELKAKEKQMYSKMFSALK